MPGIRLRFCLLVVCLGSACFGQQQVTSVDFYGLRTLTQAQVKKELGLGESVVVADLKDLKQRALKIDGVEDAKVATIQFPGNLAIFIGIQEKGQQAVAFQAAPEGDIKLRAELLQQYDATMDLLLPAIKSGKATEDKSAGHSISEYEPMRKLQLQFIPIANEEFDELAKVLHESSDADSRTAAAYILAYADDKRRAIEQLAFAADDADSGVRNNAVRALSVLSSYANANPDLDLEVDPKSFLQLLSSLSWTDRNKGAAVLDSLSQQRDAQLMDALRSTSLPELEEMARWKSSGHCWFSIRILARMAGLSEADIKSRAKASENHDDRMRWVDQLMDQVSQP